MYNEKKSSSLNKANSEKHTSFSKTKTLSKKKSSPSPTPENSLSTRDVFEECLESMKMVGVFSNVNEIDTATTAIQNSPPEDRREMQENLIDYFKLESVSIDDRMRRNSLSSQKQDQEDEKATASPIASQRFSFSRDAPEPARKRSVSFNPDIEFQRFNQEEPSNKIAPN